MVRAIERGAGDDEWKDARAEFSAADKDWAVHYTSVARDVAFYVDTPFTVEAKDKMKLVWPLPCDAYAVGRSGGIDPSSARLVLEVVNHCAGLVKNEIEKTVDAEAGSANALRTAASSLGGVPASASTVFSISFFTSPAQWLTTSSTRRADDGSMPAGPPRA